MELTESFDRVVPESVGFRYSWMETRNAAAVLSASNPREFQDILDVLDEFYLYDLDLLTPGGSRGLIPIRLDALFERLGWRAVRINMRTTLNGHAKATMGRAPYTDEFLNSEVSNNGYEVDNMRQRVVVDVEWNAKDGNLDRDLSAYRALYELGLIDAACIITRDHVSIKNLALNVLRSEDAARRLGTTTSTNMAKLADRLARGDAGGCPVLAVGISDATWAGPGVTSPSAAKEEDLASDHLD